MIRFILIVTFLFGSLSLAAGPTQPATQPATQPVGIQMSEVQVRQLPEMNYVYASVKTLMSQIPQQAEKFMPLLMAQQAEGKIKATGPVIFVYKGFKGDFNEEFELQIGTMAATDSQPAAPFAFKKLPAQKCATLLFGGPLNQIGKAYEKLMTQVFSAGMEPLDESREMYLYWEGPESPNNVTLIQVGVK